MEPGQDPRRVFLNIPFDIAYEPIFIGLVAALVRLGKRPTTVLELGGGAEPRLDRLLEQIRGSRFSVHDLSRVQTSGRAGGEVPRFNMPFELGLAVAVARLQRAESAHAFALLEARPFRLQRSLSDMNGFDPMIHNGTRAGAVRCMYEIFCATGRCTIARTTKPATPPPPPSRIRVGRHRRSGHRAR